MIEYNKLVRDNIPRIIAEQGDIPVTRILNEEAYALCLERKLDEEVGEYHRDKNTEELADILEVVFALAELHGCTREELLAICQNKHDLRGGFRDRVFLIGKETGK